MIILGIETSCDETAVAILNNNKQVLSHKIYSQIKQHKKWGGVVPEVASRSHSEVIDSLVSEAIKEADIKISEVDAFAATCGPGMAGGLIVGVLAAKTLSLVFNKPFIAVNHLQGHALVPSIAYDIKFPFLLLLASGGHTQILDVKAVNDYKVLGSTLDDAIGETFDKSARIMGLSYPGGAEIEKMAQEGNPNKYDFPVPLQHKPGCDFSFSGLKTAVRNVVISKENLTQQDICDISASLQNAITKSIISRIKNALLISKIKHNTLVFSGGVSANNYIRNKIIEFCDGKGITSIFPPNNLSTDNGIMIAWAAMMIYEQNKNLYKGLGDIDYKVNPRWQLNEIK